MDNKDFASMIRRKVGEIDGTNSGINAQERQRYASTAFGTLMRKVYLWMTLAPALLWGLIIAELALVIGLSAAIRKLSLPVATLMFVIYSVINGVTLSSIFLVYSIGSIAKVFLITAGTFGAMALFGYTTKKDLSSMGKILFMALIGLIIATVVNLFVKSSGLDLILCYGGVLIFVGLTAWDSQKIKEMCMSAEYADEGAQKMALLGALTLYLDFINLFLYLLRIFGRRE